MPLGHPDAALGIGPDAARALSFGRRLDDGRRPARRVDPGDVIAGERGVVDVPLGRRGDAVGAGAAWRLPDIDLAAARVEAAVDSALSGEPVDSVAVERAGVQVGVAGI